MEQWSLEQARTGELPLFSTWTFLTPSLCAGKAWGAELACSPSPAIPRQWAAVLLPRRGLGGLTLLCAASERGKFHIVWFLFL